MGFWERLTAIEIAPNEARFPFHDMALGALGEFERGKLTRAEIIAAFNISPAEEADLDSLLAKVTAWPEAYPMGAFVNVANMATSFDGTAAQKGLGFTAVDVTGITRLTCRFRYNKQSANPLFWQLWNQTDAQEIGAFTDVSAAGDDKENQIEVTPAGPLTGGVKAVRLRMRGTAATDDAQYYGSCLVLRRVGRLTADDIHGILTLARAGVPPLDTIAAVKARLQIP